MKDVEVFVGLVHGPVKNKNGEEVTTSVTNLDIHDIARSCRTFGVKRYFLITPLKAQHELVGRILQHWQSDVAREYNPDRQDALAYIEISETYECSIQRVEELTQKRPLVVVTGANFESFNGEEKDLVHLARSEKRPILLLFGTGWGLAPQLLENANFRLTPIYGLAEDGYNHLSVRSAVAIYLDRLARQCE